MLFVAVGCFLFFLVFLLSARPDAAIALGARKCSCIVSESPWISTVNW